MLSSVPTTQSAYRAVALQTACHAVNAAPSAAESRRQIRQAIERLGEQVLATRRLLGPDLRLVVLPEYVLTGHPLAETFPQWIERAVLAPDGEEWRLLGEISRTAGVYLCVNAYESDGHFPGLYFQASVVLDPKGDAILRYRRLNSMYAVTPHDVMDRYLAVYGEDSLFPVVRTEIGVLAAVASEEILFPEVARCLAMRGAEVILHSSSEISSALQSPKNVAKLARAVENGVYVVSANTAGLHGTGLPPLSGDGGSKIVDHRGLVLAAAAQGESMAANAEIDLGALRRFRSRPAQDNLLARQRFDLYARSYATHSFYPPNTVTDQVESREHFAATQRDVIARLKSRGVL